MVDFVGRSGELALFSNGSDAAVVNTDLNLVVGIGEHSVLSAVREWQKTDEVISSSITELAAGAITTLDIKVVTASAGRAYTIPDGAKAEAQKALDWHKEHHRGGTPVGLNTARTLAKGGQIGIEKIRHIAKYFPRHEVDKKGKGWKPGEDGFPSNGRIAWALWGGDTAWRWAKAIVERENKKALTAGGYALPGYQDSVENYKTADAYDSSMDAFKMAHQLDPEHGPEFMARVCLDGTGIDRLYKVDFDGKVCVWDGKGWDDLGHVDGDVWSYDRALDDPYDHVEKDHFIIDPESAVAISGHLQENPFKKVTLEDIDAYEANLMADGIPDEDWKMVDYALTAAGDSMSGTKGSKPTGAVKAGDGQYTTAERSNIAKGAPRDATGKFAKTGGRAVVGNNAATGAGTIVGRSKTPGNILFKKDSDGQTIDVPAKYSTPEDQFKAPAAGVEYGKPLDTSGILGEPRTPNDMPGAHLKGTLPPMTQQDMQSLLNDWPSYVQSQRESFTPTDEADARKYAKDTNQRVREVPTVTRTPITTFKDGKLVKQNRTSTGTTAPKAAPAAPAPSAGPVAQATGVGKPRQFNPGNNQLPGSPNMSRVKGPTLPAKPATPLRKIDMSKGTKNLLPGSPNMSRVTAPLGPGPRKPSGKGGGALMDFFNGTKKPGNPYAGRPEGRRDGSKPGSTINPKVADKRNPADAGRYPGYTADQNKKKSGFGYGPMAGGKPKPGFDDKGRYVVQKGDNLWSISDKYKPKGQTTAQYWNKVLDANKGKFKSGNPSLIYSGERVTLPGVYSPTKPSAPKMTPSQKRNADAKEYGQGILKGIAKDKAQKEAKRNADAKAYGQGIMAGQAKAKAAADKRNADAKAYGQGILAGKAKAKAAADAKRNADAKAYGQGILSGKAKAQAQADKRNADAKAYGQGIMSGQAKAKAAADAKRNADAKAYGQGILSGKAKAQAQADKRNSDAKAYGQGIMSGQAKAKAAADAKRNADAKAYGQGIMSGQAKAKAAADKRNADAKAYGQGILNGIAKKRNDDAKAYGQGIMSGIAKDKASKTGLDDKGRHIVQKGDSLWSIADKRKPAGESTASYWSKVMKANPKEQFKSKNPSLIYSGERVNLPGAPKKADSRNAPGSNKETKKSGFGYGPMAKTGPKKPTGQPGAWSTSPTRPAAPTKPTRPVPKAPARPAAPTKPTRPVPKQTKPSPDSVERNTPKPPSKQPQRNPIRETLEKLKDRTEYKQEVFKPKAEQAPAQNGVRPKTQNAPAQNGVRPKRGKAGTRKRTLPEG